MLNALRVSLALVAVAAPQTEADTSGSDVLGHWEGRIHGLALDFDVDLEAADEAGGLSGDVSIPAQGARDLPLESILLDGPQITFVIAGIPGDPSFRGTVSDDGTTVTGTLTQGGAEFPFQMRRAIEVAPPDTGLEAFGPWMREAMEAWEVPGAAVAIVRADTAALMEGYGVRELGGDARVDADTLFAIGSASKAFTTFTIATSIEAAELSWADKIEDLLPGFRLDDPRASAELTLRDVVTHRLGLPRHDLTWYGRTDRTAAEIVAGMRHLPMNAELRETFQYNNLGFLVAGEVLRDATGLDWGELVRARILVPLGMRRSTTSGAPFLADPNHATGHGDVEDEVRVLPFRNIDVVAPAGGIGSSVSEMARWVRLQLRNGRFEGAELLQRSTFLELHTPQTIVSSLPEDPMLGIAALAHGWFVDGYRGHLQIHHGGHIDGYSALVALFPQDDLGVVCLTNRNGTPLPELAIRRAADLALGLEPRDWSGEALEKRDAGSPDGGGEGEGDADETPRIEDTTPSHALEAYGGDYVHPGYGTLSIDVGGDEDAPALALRLGELGGPLEHWHFDTFRVPRAGEESTNPLGGLLVRYETNETGGVAALHVTLEPALPPLRFEAASDPRLEDPDVLEAFVGTFEFRGVAFVVSMRPDGSLVADVAGQPTFTLVPGRDDTFTIAEAEGFSVKFRREDDGTVSAVELRQPNGTFVARRSDDDSAGD
ncbi:MAG: serine hydrolase [Planctomycetota bacterium]